MGSQRARSRVLALVAAVAACELSHPIAGPGAVPDASDAAADATDALPTDVFDVVDASDDVVDASDDVVDASDDVVDASDDAVDASDDVVDASDDVVDVVDVPPAMDVVDVPPPRDVADVPPAMDVADVPPGMDVVDVPLPRDVVDVPPGMDVVDVPPPRDVVDVPVVPDAGGPVTQNITAGENCGNAPAMNAAIGWWRYTGRTTNAGDDLLASCAVGQTARPDVVWRLTLSATRRVSFALRATDSWNPVLSVIDGDCARRPVDPMRAVAEREIACVDDSPGQGTGATPSMVLPAGTWFVVVDGNNSSGSFTLDVRIEDAPSDGGPDPASTGDTECPAVPPTAARVTLRDDEGSAPVPLGFSFPLYGQAFGRLSISSNGFVQLLRDGENPAGVDVYSNAIIPNDAAPNAIVAPFWDDLNPGEMSDRVRWWTTMNPRAIHVRWVDVPRWNESSQRVTVDLRLEETGWIQFHYCALTPTVPGSRALGTSATAGIESADGRRGYLYSLWQPFVFARRQLRFPPR